MQEQYFFRAGTIDLTRTIYIWDTHGLYIVDRPSVFSKQTVSRMPVFGRFFSFFPAIGRKYRILVMHKMQSVKTEKK